MGDRHQSSYIYHKCKLYFNSQTVNAKGTYIKCSITTQGAVSVFSCLFSEQVAVGRKSPPGFWEALGCRSIFSSDLALAHRGGPLLTSGDSADKRNLYFCTTRWRFGWQEPNRNGTGRNSPAGRRQRPESPTWRRFWERSGTDAGGTEGKKEKSIISLGLQQWC